jgi:sugar/nucleoside kinase (ribokinase family)
MADLPLHPRTVSVGGATFDLFVRMEKKFMSKAEANNICFMLGGKIPVKEIIETCGGGASNTSVGLSRLGCQAAFCGIVGNDQWGNRLLENLTNENVDTSCATVVEGETSSSSIILSVGSGERTILYNAGTNAHLRTVTFDREKASHCDWIYLNHLPGDSHMIQGHLSEILEQNNHPTGLTWNPGGHQIEAGIVSPQNIRLLKHASILLLNKEEAISFTREPSVEGAIKALLEAGVRTIFVTDGPNGAIAADRLHFYRCPVIGDSPIVDTTGAGDAFGVGVSWAILRGMDLPNALRAGTINATSVLGTLGAQAGLLTDIEMQKRLQSVQLDVRMGR